MDGAKDFLSDHHIVNGLYPVADAFATSATTDYVSVENYRRVGWVVHTGNSTGGDSDGVITVLAATSAAGAGATAMAFRYRLCASSTTVDTWGALTACASTGVALTGADNTMAYVEVSADEVAAALSTASFVALKVTEDTDDPVVAGILTILMDPRYPGAVPVSAIA